MPKSNAQRAREFRQRQNANKNKIKTTPKTPAERARAYRERQKKIFEQQKQSFISNENNIILDLPNNKCSEIDGSDILKGVNTSQDDYTETEVNNFARIAKSYAAWARMFWQRQNANKVKIKTTPKTSAERVRAYRERQKQQKLSVNSNEKSNVSDVANSTCSQLMGGDILIGNNTSHNDYKEVSTCYSNKNEALTEEQPINTNTGKSNANIVIEIEINTPIELDNEQDKLLVPHKVLEIEDVRKKEIACWKTVIAKLSENEVDNSINLPYIKSEKVDEDDLEEPAQHLQIHRNEDSPDEPLLDFRSNSEEFDSTNVYCNNNHGSKKQQILEARSLFTQCGRALQRQRQNGECQDLLHKEQLQRCEEDPAASDPALLKRLEKNKIAAVKKESEILERYSVPQEQANVFSQLHSEIYIKDEYPNLDGSVSEEMNLSNSDILYKLSQEKESQSETSSTNEDTHISGPNEINDMEIKNEPEEKWKNSQETSVIITQSWYHSEFRSDNNTVTALVKFCDDIGLNMDTP